MMEQFMLASIPTCINESLYRYVCHSARNQTMGHGTCITLAIFASEGKVNLVACMKTDKNALPGQDLRFGF